MDGKWGPVLPSVGSPVFCPLSSVYRYLRPLLFRLDAEAAHNAARRAAKLAQAGGPAGGLAAVRALFRFEHDALRQRLLGIEFANPVGLAAGFDKNAELVAFWAALGFGFAEVGSVTARPSAGNPRPRAFRLPADRALVNRMGLNNDGADAVAERLQTMDLARSERPLPLGVNLAKTHDPAILGDAATEDFVTSFRRLAPVADYVALNVSCPNTAEGKTFEEPSAFDGLLTAVMAARVAYLVLTDQVRPDEVLDRALPRVGRRRRTDSHRHVSDEGEA